MKTSPLKLGAAMVVLLPIAGDAAATFAFRNSPAYGVDAPVFNADGLPLEGTRFVATLYGGPTADSLAPAFMWQNDRIGGAIADPFGTGTRAGYFYPREAAGATVAVIPTVPGKGLAWLQVRAWDTTLGSTYEEVVARGLGGYGESNLFQSQGGCPECEPPFLPGTLAGLQSFRLLPIIPEPSAWALLAFGGAGLWLAARWQRRSGCSSGKAQNGGPGRC